MTEDQIRQFIAEEIKRSSADARTLAYENMTMSAWQTNRMELDKALLAISAGGIALTITLVTQFGIPSATVLYLQIAAIVVFALAGATLLLIFQQNAAILAASLRGHVDDRSLRRLDGFALGLVFAGIVLLSTAGISAAQFKFRKEQAMKQPQQSQTGLAPKQEQQQRGPEQGQRSMGGWQDMRPVTQQSTPPDQSPSASTPQPAQPKPQQPQPQQQQTGK